MIIIGFLIAVGILVMIELSIYHRRGLDDLDIKVDFSQDIANCGDTIEVIEVAQNNKRIPLPFILLKFETPVAIQFLDMENVTLTDNFYREDMLTLKSFSRHTRKIKVRCNKRGFYTFPRITASSSDLFLIQKLGRDFESDSCITILPEVLSSDELMTLLSVTFSETTSRRTLLTDPFSFAGIREYQPWDPMRSINWTASARAGDFMVNQTTSTSDRRINLFINLERYNTKNSVSLLEKAISLAYTYMLNLTEQGITVSMYCNGKDIITDTPILHPSTGIIASSDAGIELARIDLNKPVLPFSALSEEYISKDNSSDLNVIISPNFDDGFRANLSSLIAKGKQVLWVMPCYMGDPFVKRFSPESDIAPHLLKWEVAGHD